MDYERDKAINRLAHLTFFEEIQKLQLKFKAWENLIEDKDPPFHTWYTQAYTKLFEENENLKDLKIKIKELEDYLT